MSQPVAAERVRVVPANEASWDDLVAIFGETGTPARCQCQWFKAAGCAWRETTRAERVAMLREGTGCGKPRATTTSGLVAYAAGEPAGWLAVEPRTAYPKLKASRIPWRDRIEDRDDGGVWAMTCFVVRKGFRGRGLTYHLARAAVPYARERGARALEGYPMIVEPGREIAWGELYVGARQVFAEAGFREVSHPTVRRVVMRIDFEGGEG